MFRKNLFIKILLLLLAGFSLSVASQQILVSGKVTNTIINTDDQERRFAVLDVIDNFK